MPKAPKPSPHPESAPPPPPAGEAPDIVLQVRLRPAHVARLRAFAAREGATAEALAALWLEEKLDEATQGQPRPVGAED
jgi:hypothetical protein